jgi:hypothetical protein
VDPADDCTFWYTTEYYTAASQATSAAGWLTRIGSFSLTASKPARGAGPDASTPAAIGAAPVVSVRSPGP